MASRLTLVSCVLTIRLPTCDCMHTQIIDFLDELWRNLRIADAFDILLIAALLYCALLWFGETTSRRMLVGVTLLALVYLAARMLDMRLTSLAFHTGLTVLLIVLVVLFQDDLRRMLTRATAWLSLSRNSKAASSERETLVESAFALAKTRTGALLVLPGSEPLQRHLHGGVSLDGLISPQLIDSIFDASSAGHDGAAIIEGDRITRFGAHLPISTNLKVIKGRGTRHSAAVGLSECSDAIVIAVSEERGTVSVAQDGELSAVDSPAALLKRLEDSPALRSADQRRHAWTLHLTAHWRLMVLAFSMAAIAWFVLAYDPATVARSYDVQIEYRDVPKGLVLDRPVSQAQLTLSGSEAAFRFISPESLTLSVNLENRSAGNLAVTLGPENIQLPANVQIDSIEPDILWLYLREQTPKPNGNGAGP